MEYFQAEVVVPEHLDPVIKEILSMCKTYVTLEGIKVLVSNCMGAQHLSLSHQDRDLTEEEIEDAIEEFFSGMDTQIIHRGTGVVHVRAV